MSKRERESRNDRPVGFCQALGSALAAMVGVQSSKTRERDFKHGKASTFIAAGLILTATVVIGLYAVVRFVLYQAGL